MTSQAVKDNYKKLKEVGQPVHLLPLFYVGGGSFTLDGTNDHQLAQPPDATCVEVRARGGEVYFAINGVAASAASPFYVPQDAAEFVGPLYNLETVHAYSDTVGAVVHWAWFKEM